MSRDLTPLPLDETGNGSRLKTLTFDEADAPMLMQALSIAVNTAMMCSGQESVRRLQYYKQQFKLLAPPAAKLLNRDTDLCEIAVASATATSWSIHRVKERTWSNIARIVVTIGDRRFFSDNLLDLKSNDYHTIASMVESIVPYTCVRCDKEDVIGNPWTCR